MLLAVDPIRALDRFRQQPYEALIVDVGTVGDDGLLVFEGDAGSRHQAVPVQRCRHSVRGAGSTGRTGRVSTELRHHSPPGDAQTTAQKLEELSAKQKV
ncbi:MAG: hypothetical protein U0736_01460 [Gemmataceae bacterium]